MNYTEKFNIIIDNIKSVLEGILPSGSRIALYGSRARGDFNDDSDWDFHILIPGEDRLSLNRMDDFALPVERLGWEFGEVFSTSVYSFKDWEKRKNHPFYENVEKDKIIIYNKI